MLLVIRNKGWQTRGKGDKPSKFKAAAGPEREVGRAGGQAGWEDNMGSYLLTSDYISRVYKASCTTWNFAAGMKMA